MNGDVTAGNANATAGGARDADRFARNCGATWPRPRRARARRGSPTGTSPCGCGGCRRRRARVALGRVGRRGGRRGGGHPVAARRDRAGRGGGLGQRRDWRVGGGLALPRSSRLARARASRFPRPRWTVTFNGRTATDGKRGPAALRRRPGPARHHGDHRHRARARADDQALPRHHRRLGWHRPARPHRDEARAPRPPPTSARASTPSPCTRRCPRAPSPPTATSWPWRRTGRGGPRASRRRKRSRWSPSPPGRLTGGALLRDGLVEGPGVGDDVPQRGTGRVPAELAAGLVA